MSRYLSRAQKVAHRSPLRRLRRPAVLVALVDVRPVPRSLVILVGFIGVLVVVELAVAVAVLA